MMHAASQLACVQLLKQALACGRFSRSEVFAQMHGKRKVSELTSEQRGYFYMWCLDQLGGTHYALVTKAGSVVYAAGANPEEAAAYLNSSGKTGTLVGWLTMAQTLGMGQHELAGKAAMLGQVWVTPACKIAVDPASGIGRTAVTPVKDFAAAFPSRKSNGADYFSGLQVSIAALTEKCKAASQMLRDRSAGYMEVKEEPVFVDRYGHEHAAGSEGATKLAAQWANTKFASVGYRPLIDESASFANLESRIGRWASGGVYAGHKPALVVHDEIITESAFVANPCWKFVSSDEDGNYSCVWTERDKDGGVWKHETFYARVDKPGSTPKRDVVSQMQHDGYGKSTTPSGMLACTPMPNAWGRWR